jgi:hypothetical protein
MLNPTLRFPQIATTSRGQLESLEADLATFLRVPRSGNLVDQRRQAQELVDRLDVVRNYAKLLRYVRFTDHVSRPLITEAFTRKNEKSIRSAYESCVVTFAFSHPRLRSHQSPLNAKPNHLHRVASREYTRERSRVGPLQSKISRLTARQTARSCPR